MDASLADVLDDEVARERMSDVPDDEKPARRVRRQSRAGADGVPALANTWATSADASAGWSAYRWQAATQCASTWSSGGRSVQHTSMTFGQRGANGQPRLRLAAGRFGFRLTVLAPALGAVGQRDRGDQQARVGVARLMDDFLDAAGLDHGAAIEHDDVLADLIGGGQVVRDVEDRDAEVAVQRLEAAEDGRAQRGVDHRDRLVGHDHARPAEQCARHADALALAAAELVREAAERLGRPKADPFERLLDQGPLLAPVVRQAESTERRGEHVVDAVERVEGLVRVLKDRLHLAAELHALPTRHGGQVLAAVEHLA